MALRKCICSMKIGILFSIRLKFCNNQGLVSMFLVTLHSDLEIHNHICFASVYSNIDSYNSTCVGNMCKDVLELKFSPKIDGRDILHEGNV